MGMIINCSLGPVRESLIILQLKIIKVFVVNVIAYAVELLMISETIFTRNKSILGTISKKTVAHRNTKPRQCVVQKCVCVCVCVRERERERERQVLRVLTAKRMKKSCFT